MGLGYRSDGVRLETCMALDEAKAGVMDAASKEIVLRRTQHPRLGEVLLIERTAGTEAAGSGTRIVNSAYGAIFRHGKAGNGGQWYKTLAEAEERYNKMAAST